MTKPASFQIRTRCATDMIDVSAHIAEAVRTSGVQEGIAVVFTPHTTAAITINENADPDVVHDFCAGMDRLFPQNLNLRHAEGNSAAHIRSSLVGCSETLIISSGRPLLGTWQGIYLCEFDGPRLRSVQVKVIAG